MRFQVGDIVKISKHSKYYGDCDRNDPKDEEGKVISTNDDDEPNHPIRTSWISGANLYRENDLRLVRRRI